MASTGTPARTQGVLASDTKTYTAIFAVGFMLFMLIALFGQMLGAPWRSWLPGAEGVKSMTGGVKAAVYTFMSHLT